MSNERALGKSFCQGNELRKWSVHPHTLQAHEVWSVELEFDLWLFVVLCQIVWFLLAPVLYFGVDVYLLYNAADR